MSRERTNKPEPDARRQPNAENEREQLRRPYQPPRIVVFDATKSILGPTISPRPDGASGSFRP
jgi:hypothetical protein